LHCENVSNTPTIKAESNYAGVEEEWNLYYNIPIYAHQIRTTADYYSKAMTLAAGGAALSPDAEIDIWVAKEADPTGVVTSKMGSLCFSTNGKAYINQNDPEVGGTDWIELGAGGGDTTRAVEIQCIDTMDALTVDIHGFLRIPSVLNGWTISEVFARVYVASTGGNTEIDIYSIDDSHSILSDLMVIETDEFDTKDSSQPGTIDPDYATVHEGDCYNFQVSSKPTPAPSGLVIGMLFTPPA
jgi:hypothetical protein